LTFEELRDLLPRHSLRGTRHYLDKIEADLIPAITGGWGGSSTPRLFYNLGLDDFAAKLEFLLAEMEICPDGERKVFHLCVDILIGYWCHGLQAQRPKLQCKDTAISSILHGDLDGLVRLVEQWQSANHVEARNFIDFAAAKRHVYANSPRKCRSCCTDRPDQRVVPATPPVNQSSSEPSEGQSTFVDPLAALGLGDLGNLGILGVSCCQRCHQPRLLDPLQKWAYAEIRSGVMLTLRNKLPEELCLLIFDYALDAEEIPRDPCVWEKDKVVKGKRVRGMLMLS
jgi:hypothetical protein